jgi:hypothetical protein
MCYTVFSVSAEKVPPPVPGSAFIQYITSVKDIILAIAAATGAIVGVLGLKTWRHELHGKIEYELARRLIKACYNFRDAFALVRRRVITEGEMKPQEQSDKTTTEERMRTNSYVYDNRWKILMEAAAELDTEMLEGEVIWGAEIEKELMPPVRMLVIELREALEDFLLTSDPEQMIFTRDQTVEVRRKFLGALDGTDEFSTKLKAVVSAIETKFRPYLKR